MNCRKACIRRTRSGAPSATLAKAARAPGPSPANKACQQASIGPAQVRQNTLNVVSNVTSPWLLTGDRNSRRGEHGGRKGSKRDRPLGGQPGAPAPDAAWDEPRAAGRAAGPHGAAGAEIREGGEPHRGEPAAQDRRALGRADRLLL